MIRLFLSQMNPTVGAVESNRDLVIGGIEKARHYGCDLVVFPECALTGYPAEDLWFDPRFVSANKEALEAVREATKGITAVVGFVEADDDLYNSAAVLSDRQLAGVVRKAALPNYGVFDENRYFQAGETTRVFKLGSVKFGVTICEDIWHPDGPQRSQAVNGGAEVLVNISASPYEAGKVAQRTKMLATRASENTAFLAFCNMVGGQDELVFDGNSMVFSPSGELITRALPFEEDYIVADVPVKELLGQRLRDPRRRTAIQFDQPTFPLEKEVALKTAPIDELPVLATRMVDPLNPSEEVYRALVLGTGDYVRKNGFGGVVIGLSGGIDSALTCSVAVDALGSERVVGVTMPSAYSSSGSVDDSRELAENLGIRFEEIAIPRAYEVFEDLLEPHFAGTEPGVAEENLQARIRGTLLMALSNKFGWLVLSTGNKSETSVGYCTLYGDMAGGFDVLKDVPKLLVYKLSRWRNSETPKPWIPVSTIEKPPSAELRPDQLDTDSLPPYEVLDPILRGYVEGGGAVDELKERYGEEIVAMVTRLVDISEYKRRQAPPGVKITSLAFGRDRRFPITHGFKNRP